MTEKFMKILGEGALEKIKVILQIAQFTIVLVLSVAAFFVKAELAQIRQDRETIAELREFMAETRGNRFTAADGLKVYQEISKIREQMAKMPTETPPQWFRELVAEIKAQGDRTQATVDELRLEVIKVKTEVQHIQTEVADLKRVNGTK